MYNQNSNTIVRDAQNVLVELQVTQGYITALQWAECQPARRKAVDSDPEHRAWLKAMHLDDVNPSEFFAS